MLSTKESITNHADCMDEEEAALVAALLDSSVGDCEEPGKLTPDGHQEFQMRLADWLAYLGRRHHRDSRKPHEWVKYQTREGMRRRLAYIEGKYSTANGASADERMEAQDLCRRLYPG